MENLNKIQVVSVALLLLVVSTISSYVGFGDDENMMTSNQRQTEAEECKTPIIDAAKRLFSLPTAPDSWIHKVKGLFRQGWPYSSPPNLDFRGGSGRSEEGATKNVKNAAVKSLDKSKATVEDSAKTAAKFAEEAVGKTVKKLKKTLSGEGQQEVGTDHEAEL